MCPDERKGCSVWNLLIIKTCRAEHLLSNYIKYVMIGYKLIKLLIPEHSTVGTHKKRKTPNYLLFIDILGETA